MNKIEKKKNFMFFTFFVMVACASTFYLFQSSLGKYRQQAEHKTKVNPSVWKILINDEDIKGKKTLESGLNLNIVDSPYVNEGTIAPGSSASCDVIIDSKETTLPFQIMINATIENELLNPDFKITGYVINPTSESNEIIPYNGTSITYNVSKDTEITTVRFYMAWSDDSDNVLDNDADTNLALTEEYLPVVVTLNLKQTNA